MDHAAITPTKEILGYFEKAVLTFAEVSALLMDRCSSAHLALLIKARMYRMTKAMSELADESMTLSDMLFEFTSISNNNYALLMYIKKNDEIVPSIGVIQFRILNNCIMEAEKISIRLDIVEAVKWNLSKEST